MRAVYIALLLILLATYGPTLYWVKKRSPGLTPLLGWMAGLGFFLIVPLTAITLNGGYKAPQVYEINGWGDVNLSNLSSLEPFIVIWLSIAWCEATGNRPPRTARHGDASRNNASAIIELPEGSAPSVWRTAADVPGRAAGA